MRQTRKSESEPLEEQISRLSKICFLFDIHNKRSSGWGMGFAGCSLGGPNDQTASPRPHRRWLRL